MNLGYIVDHIPKTTPHNRRPGIAMVPEFLTIHSTANESSSARNERAWVENPSNKRTASWHICVDEKEAIEMIPLNEVAWHAGDGRNGTGNRKSIALEICESGDRQKTLENAALLAAKILRERGWGIDKLRRHWDWSGKPCPRILMDNNWAGWNTFLNKIGEVDSVFKDINEAWYPSLIEEAESLGLVAGYQDGTFRPKEVVTREQLIYFLMRYRGRDIHQDTIADIVGLWKRSVVEIRNDKQDGGSSTGSGSFVSADGLILTNKHVTEKCKDLTVTWYHSQKFPARFIREASGGVDLALIKVDGIQTKPVVLASGVPKHGEFCVVLGSALSLKDSATFGIISNPNRDGQYIQVDAAVNPGNSGGACFDLQGNMIGVPTLKFVGATVDNVAYLTSVIEIKKFLGR